MTGVVVWKTSVVSGLSVRESSSFVALMLTVGGAVVRPKSMLVLCSVVRDEATSVPSWFCVLELWIPVEDSVEVSTLEIGPWCVPEVFVEPAGGEVTDGVWETGRPNWLVLSSVLVRSGVESEVSFDVEMS